MTHLRLPPLAVCLCALSGFLFWWSLKWGIGLSPDSMFYLDQSAQLAEDFSIARFQDKAPPLYPFVQFVTDRLIDDTFSALKFLHVSLYILNTALFASLVFSITGGSRAFALLAVVLHSGSPTIYTIHSHALTEPLFITFLLLAVLFMHRFFTSSVERWLVLSGAAVGLMLLTRFAGLSFLASFFLSLLFFSRSQPAFVIVQRLAKFSVPAIVLPLLWAALKVFFDAGASSPRSLQFHPVSAEQLRQLFDVFAGWMFIDQSVAIFAMVLVVFAHVFYVRLAAGPRLLLAFFLFNAFFYAVFILVSISLFDAYTPIDQRIFLPVLYLALLLLLDASHGFWQRSDGVPKRIEVGALLVSIAVLGGFLTSQTAVNNFRLGQGFMSKAMQEISLHDVVRDSDVETVYTNSPELVRLHVGKKALLLPQFFDASSGVTNDSWIAELGAVLQEVDGGSAAIVYYNAVNWRTYLPAPDFLNEQYGLVPSYVTDEGAIFWGSLR